MSTLLGISFSSQKEATTKKKSVARARPRIKPTYELACFDDVSTHGGKKTTATTKTTETERNVTT